MSRWFRLYEEVLTDPKVQRLSDKNFKAWINLLCVASRSHHGILPPVDDLAFALRWSKSKTVEIFDELVRVGLFEMLPLSEANPQYYPHNWDSRQFKSDVSTTRVKRFRDKKRNVSSTVSETPPESETDTEAKTEQKDSGAAAPVIDLFPNIPTDEKKSYFNRSKEILGAKGSGLAAKLLKSKGGVVSRARAVLEAAADTSDPQRYVAGACHRQELQAADPRSGYGDDWG